MELKPCPFCGGEAELKKEHITVGDGSYRQYQDYHKVQCNTCLAQAERIRQQPLCNMTEHTVQDFRNNPALRAKVEDEYEEYCNKVRLKAVEAWNKRRELWT